MHLGCLGSRDASPAAVAKTSDTVCTCCECCLCLDLPLPSENLAADPPHRASSSSADTVGRSALRTQWVVVQHWMAVSVLLPEFKITKLRYNSLYLQLPATPGRLALGVGRSFHNLTCRLWHPSSLFSQPLLKSISPHTRLPNTGMMDLNLLLFPSIAAPTSSCGRSLELLEALLELLEAMCASLFIQQKKLLCCQQHVHH